MCQQFALEKPGERPTVACPIQAFVELGTPNRCFGTSSLNINCIFTRYIVQDMSKRSFVTAMDSTMAQYLRLVFKMIHLVDSTTPWLTITFFLLEDHFENSLSQRHKINTFDERPMAASSMQLYINDLKNQIEFSRQFFQWFVTEFGGQFRPTGPLNVWNNNKIIYVKTLILCNKSEVLDSKWC